MKPGGTWVRSASKPTGCAQAPKTQDGERAPLLAGNAHRVGIESSPLSSIFKSSPLAAKTNTITTCIHTFFPSRKKEQRSVDIGQNRCYAVTGSLRNYNIHIVVNRDSTTLGYTWVAVRAQGARYRTHACWQQALSCLHGTACGLASFGAPASPPFPFSLKGPPNGARTHVATNGRKIVLQRFHEQASSMKQKGTCAHYIKINTTTPPPDTTSLLHSVVALPNARCTIGQG